MCQRSTQTAHLLSTWVTSGFCTDVPSTCDMDFRVPGFAFGFRVWSCDEVLRGILYDTRVTPELLGVPWVFLIAGV